MFEWSTAQDSRSLRQVKKKVFMNNIRPTRDSRHIGTYERRSARGSVSVLSVFATSGLLLFSARAEVAAPEITIVGEATLFAPNIASTDHAEIRLTISPDGQTGLWFSRDRPGGPGGYDIWISHKDSGDPGGWSAATPVPFNSKQRDFDPAFSSDGMFVYFCSDRAGGFGGDDIYRVGVTKAGFGAVENVGAAVNSSGNEFAPMLSGDGRQLLFSSDRAAGAGGHDLFVAHRRADQFEIAQRLEGHINTNANEFDATFLSDNTTIVFARAKDFRRDRVDLFASRQRDGRYEVGTLLPASVNTTSDDTYGPMLDWSRPDHFTFSAQRAGGKSMDLYTVQYRLTARSSAE
jgi:Tol biopolymer transport system component